MPQPPLRPCTAPGCRIRVPGGRCEQHSRLAGRQRDTWTAMYGRDWPRRRLEYLAANPVCILCGRMATVADHHPAGIRLLKARGATDPHADHHLRPLCASCHSKETGRKEPGGWNRR